MVFIVRVNNSQILSRYGTGREIGLEITWRARLAEPVNGCPGANRLFDSAGLMPLCQSRLEKCSM